jgi:carboxyl-terminal processing protease
MRILLAGLLMGMLGLYTAGAQEAEHIVIGIGVGVHSVDQHPVIDEVIPGQSAFKGGVKVGDRLVEVDGKSVDGLSLVDISKLLRGKQGTRVKIVVERDGKRHSFSLKRQIVTYPQTKEIPSGE